MNNNNERAKIEHFENIAEIWHSERYYQLLDFRFAKNRNIKTEPACFEYLIENNFLISFCF